MRVEASVLIEAPIRVVFAFAANPCCWSEWITGFSSICMMSARTPDVGETFYQENGSGGNSSFVRWEVIEYEPPRAICCRRITGVNPALLHQVFASINGSTRLTMSLEGKESGLFTTGPEIQRVMTVQVGHDLHRLKELLEDRTAQVDAEARGLIGGQDAGA